MEKIKLLVKGIISNIIFSTILFLSAGRIDYAQGWIFLAVNIVSTFANFMTIRHNSDLINERATVKEGVKSWDKMILGFSAIIYVLTVVVAGLDSGRFGWTPGFNWRISVIGVLIMATGQFLFLSARHSNNFFSSTVRIQKERGHSVCDSGLYSFVRHPGYLGMSISLMSIPLITVSKWSFVPTAIAIILIIVRTSLEDKTLIAELDGYQEFTNKTRYRLIPFIW